MFALTACNSALLVHKGNVVYNQPGYIVFYYPDQEALFFPWKDTLDERFLQVNHKNGFRLDRDIKDLVYLGNLATKNIVLKDIIQDGRSLQVDDTMRIIPVKIRYYWGDSWRPNRKINNDQKTTIRYSYLKNNVELKYRIYDNRRILLISVVRTSDINNIREPE